MDQSRPHEKKSISSLDVQTIKTAFGGDEIRQIQMLMVLLSCLPPDGKVREVLELALALPHESVLSRLSPPKDTSFDGLKTWLGSLWVREGLTSEEQALVNWQKSIVNIAAAVQELKAAEQKLGLKFDVSRIL